MKRISIALGALIALSPLVYIIANSNYVLFHTIIEFLLSMMGFLIFVVVIGARKYNPNNSMEYIGFGFLFSSLVVFLHLLTYKGMSVIPGYDSNLTAQLWIVLNYIQSISILLAILLSKKKIKRFILPYIYIVVTFFLVWSCFVKIFPTCFVEGQGLTSFKILSEVVFMIIYLIAIAFLALSKGKIQNLSYRSIIFALSLLIISGIEFTLFDNLYGINNFIGHYIRFLGIVVLFINVMKYNIEIPYHEIKRSKSLLEISNKKQRAIFDKALIGMFIASMNDEIIDANIMCTELLGYSLDELKKLKFVDITHPEDIGLTNSLKVQFAIKKTIKTEKRYIKKNGDILYASITSSIVDDENNNPLYAITTVEDISERIAIERKKREIEIQSQNEQKLKSIGVLASGVAHEINNPINGIMNYGQIVCDMAEDGDEYYRCGEEIIHETKRVATIVQDLLRFSRQETHSFEPASMEEIFEHSMSLVYALMRKEQIIFDVEVEPNLPKIECRSQQIQQVIINLLTNGRDALNSKYKGFNENKKMSIRAEKYVKNDKPNIRIIIQDNGSGIAEDIQKDIFDPFFTTKERTKGTGLGLSISYGIVLAHKGTMVFETVKNEYTKFVITLPLKQK